MISVNEVQRLSMKMNYHAITNKLNGVSVEGCMYYENAQIIMISMRHSASIATNAKPSVTSRIAISPRKGFYAVPTVRPGV